MYLMVATGWTMSFWLAQILWENAQVILLQYSDWVLWYILITSLVSFGICYRFGPVTNTRTKKIIQWSLQVKLVFLKFPWILIMILMIIQILQIIFSLKYTYQWLITAQVFGLVLLYYSSNFREASFACCVIVVFLYNFPIFVIHKGRQYWWAYIF